MKTSAKKTSVKKAAGKGTKGGLALKIAKKVGGIAIAGIAARNE